MKALGVAWEGLLGEAEVERMRRYCGEQGWELAGRHFLVTGAPKLGLLMARVRETGVGRVLLTRDVLTELEQGYPHMWAAVQARFERQHVFVVAV